MTLRIVFFMGLVLGILLIIDSILLTEYKLILRDSFIVVEGLSDRIGEDNLDITHLFT